MDAGIAQPLFRVGFYAMLLTKQLLNDESSDIQAEALAVLCNTVLGFSPMKKFILSSGGIQQLVSKASSMETNIRLNSVWGLKNLVYMADYQLKEAVMQELTYPGLFKFGSNPCEY